MLSLDNDFRMNNDLSIHAVMLSAHVPIFSSKNLSEKSDRVRTLLVR